MQMAKDYYEILLLQVSATDEEIKKAYRKLAMQYHPDRNPGREKWATDKFKEINEAFSVLGDPEKRGQYDRFGVGSLGDILRSPSTRKTVENLVNDFGESGLGFDFLDVILGDSLKGAVTASKTSARGFNVPGEKDSATPAGINTDDIFSQTPPPSPDVEFEITISGEEAARGLEKHLVHKGKPLTVKIPAGVTNGRKVRIPGGRQIADGEQGDIVITVRVS